MGSQALAHHSQTWRQSWSRSAGRKQSLHFIQHSVFTRTMARRLPISSINKLVNCAEELPDSRRAQLPRVFSVHPAQENPRKGTSIKLDF